VGYILAECQILVLPLDVANAHENTNFHMTIFWYIVFMTSAFYMMVILPFGLFYTETDEEKAFVSLKVFDLSVGSHGAFAPHLKRKLLP
jgi:hypothetical protein